jgi:uncharacterized membrane protein
MEIEKQRNQISGVARWLTVAGGSTAVVYGLVRRGRLGWPVAAAGGGLLLRGLVGDRGLLETLGLRTPGQESLPYGRGIKVRRSVTIDKPVNELYRFWRDFENLPRFIQHLESVQVIDERRSHWVLSAGAGMHIEWDAEITVDRENEIIGWRSIGGMIDHAGSVRFEPAPGNRGTILRVQMQYNPPGGKLASALAKVFSREPDQILQEDLARLKQFMETGEVATTLGQPEGRRGLVSKALTAAEADRFEPVEEGSIESFPASDAPSWTMGGGAR